MLLINDWRMGLRGCLWSNVAKLVTLLNPVKEPAREEMPQTTARVSGLQLSQRLTVDLGQLLTCFSDFSPHVQEMNPNRGDAAAL